LTGHSFPKNSRLRQKKDFDYLREGSKRLVLTPLVLYFRPSRFDFQHARLGLSISSKVGNAVVRNRFKRILREEFRHFEPRKTMAFDFLVVLNRKIENEKLLRVQFNGLLTQLKAL
jgi:ribonuclease P protein component